MRIKVLGTAAGGGVPQWNCACSNCVAARRGQVPRRRVAALAVSAGDNRWVLVNASCDIGHQITDMRELRPDAIRVSPISALLLTDANIDHTAGLLEFRQADTFSIYSTALVKHVVCEGPMFAQFERDDRHWHTFEAGARVRLNLIEAPQLEVHAIAVPGLLPSYAGGKETAGATVAYVFAQGGRRLVYAPIFLALDEGLRRDLESADAVLLDGTCWSDDEMIELGLGARTSRAMGHAPMWGPGGSLHVASQLGAQHRYYTHINNSNPILDSASAQARQLRDAGFAVPSDGLEIVLDGSTT
ncbi:MAG TPA: pyrroloquinoline quinone biosynthesis protein PqqB [Candidatus Eremiobacteraceae bacterium]|nr:pyrroloquinoline quinone biosynthesis protein PqqB [Candidatus Eremiobacteraceae bacterium]